MLNRRFLAVKTRCIPWCLVCAYFLSACAVQINQPGIALSPSVDTQNLNGATAWANLHLTGKLVYNAADNTTGKVSVRSLDLATGNITTIFQVPQRGWVDAVAASPDHKMMI